MCPDKPVNIAFKLAFSYPHQANTSKHGKKKKTIRRPQTHI